MRWVSASFLVSMVVLSSRPPCRAEAPAAFAPLLEQHCFRCHGNEKPKAGVNLEASARAAAIDADLATWKRVYTAVRDGEMPPGKNSLKLDDRDRFLAWLAREIERADFVDGSVPPEKWDPRRFSDVVRLRRLTRFEYVNHLRDLFQIDMPREIVDLLPEDSPGAQGFDNSADGLSFSAQHVEAYLKAARFALEYVFASNGPPPREQSRALTEERKKAFARLRLRPTKDTAEARSLANDVIGPFAEQALRRPLQTGDRDKFLAVYDRAVERGDQFADALQDALCSILVSPDFFLVNPRRRTTPPRPVEPLSAEELATRLSLFLWCSMPDEPLRAAAASGKLVEDAELAIQVERMLKDERSKRMHVSFCEQWLELRQLGVTRFPDQKTGRASIPKQLFDSRDGIRSFCDDLRREVGLVSDAIYRENRPLVELLTADFTFVSRRTVSVYGKDFGEIAQKSLRDQPETLFVRLTFENPGRAGVLSSPAWLMTTSHPDGTSPFRRGRWIYEKLLGRKLAPPPDDAAQVDEKIQRQPKTLRERLELHRSKEACAGCHNRFDHFGLALENFDAVGVWRTIEKVQPKGASHPKEIPIDTKIPLPSGEILDGPQGLRRYLVDKHQDEFLRGYVRHLVGFALSRSLCRYDECLVDRVLAELRADRGRSGGVLRTIVLSPHFRYHLHGGKEFAGASK